MAHLPYRDNPELTSISESDRVKLSLLYDDLEMVTNQLQHEDRCACEPGRKRFWKCVTGPIFVSPDAEEVLALLFARGLLKLPD